MKRKFVSAAVWMQLFAVSSLPAFGAQSLPSFNSVGRLGVVTLGSGLTGVVTGEPCGNTSKVCTLIVRAALVPSHNSDKPKVSCFVITTVAAVLPRHTETVQWIIASESKLNGFFFRDGGVKIDQDPNEPTKHTYDPPEPVSDDGSSVKVKIKRNVANVHSYTLYLAFGKVSAQPNQLPLKLEDCEAHDPIVINQDN